MSKPLQACLPGCKRLSHFLGHRDGFVAGKPGVFPELEANNLKDETVFLPPDPRTGCLARRDAVSLE